MLDLPLLRILSAEAAGAGWFLPFLDGHHRPRDTTPAPGLAGAYQVGCADATRRAGDAWWARDGAMGQGSDLLSAATRRFAHFQAQLDLVVASLAKVVTSSSAEPEAAMPDDLERYD
jgi:hypothetical protein